MSFPHSIFRHKGIPSVTSNVPVTLTESRSLITYSRVTPAQRWDLSVNGIVLPANVDAFNAWFVGLTGSLNTFEYTIPVYGESQSANLTMTADANAGDRSIAVNNASDVLPGKYFNVGGGTKLYMVQSVSGNTINFFPWLVADVSDGAPVEFESPTLTARMTNMQSFDRESRHHPASYTLSIVEVL